MKYLNARVREWVLKILKSQWGILEIFDRSGIYWLHPLDNPCPIECDEEN